MACGGCGGGSARVTTRVTDAGMISTGFRYQSGRPVRAWVVNCKDSDPILIVGDTEAQTAAGRCVGGLRLATDAEYAEYLAARGETD